MRFRSRDPDGTREAAAALGRALGGKGLVVGLVGELGAGKTAFVKGLALGLGLEGVSVASPTFVIASEYETPAGPRLVHVDLYRVESAMALEEAGFLDMLEPGAVVAVEWADRFPEALPRDRLELRIERGGVAQEAGERGGEGGEEEAEGAAGEAPRTFSARAAGARSGEVLEAWRGELASVGGIEMLERGGAEASAQGDREPAGARGKRNAG